MRTRFEELDIAIEVVGPQHHLTYGPFTICECKNWSSPVSWDELSTFREKLTARNCKFGVFIALNGVTAGFREKAKIFLRENMIIALLSGNELEGLKKHISPVDILREAYYSTIKYEGEH